MHPETRALLEKNFCICLAEKGEEETYRYIRREVPSERKKVDYGIVALSGMGNGLE